MLGRFAERQDQLEGSNHGGDGGEGEGDQDKADITRAPASDSQNPGEDENDGKEDRKVLEVPDVDGGDHLCVGFERESHRNKATYDVKDTEEDGSLCSIDLSDVPLHPLILTTKLQLG